MVSFIQALTSSLPVSLPSFVPTTISITQKARYLGLICYAPLIIIALLHLFALASLLDTKHRKLSHQHLQILHYCFSNSQYDRNSVNFGRCFLCFKSIFKPCFWIFGSSSFGRDDANFPASIFCDGTLLLSSVVAFILGYRCLGNEISSSHLITNNISPPRSPSIARITVSFLLASSINSFLFCTI